jgi:hypothetical protein
VRAQCAAAPLAASDPDRARLDAGAAALFRDHGWTWYGRPSQPPGWRSGCHELCRQYDRGVLTELRVSGPLAQFVAGLPGLFAAEPVGVIGIHAAGARADQVRALARLAVPPRPVRLVFQCGGVNPCLPAVVNSLLATAVVALDARSCGPHFEVFQTLTRTPFLTTLRELELDARDMTGAAVALLATRPLFARLDRLVLRRAEWPVLDALRPLFGDRLGA